MSSKATQGAVASGQQLGKSETTMEMMQELAKGFALTPLDVRLNFTWSLRCKLAVKCRVYGMKFEEACVMALQGGL